MRRVRLSAAALIAASMLLAGCGGGDEEADAPKGQDVSEGTTLSAVWPLTGLDAKGDKGASLEHPVFVVKIDNTSSSSPQVGLGSADLVVEQLVEGGSTRLAAFFYSQLPSEVGPVRSMRASDIGIVSPVGGSLIASGGAPQTISRIKGAGIRIITEGAKGISRDSARSSTYSVMADLGAIAKANGSDAARPDDYLTWGEEADFPKGQPAKSLTASFSGGHTTNWSYGTGGYVNESSYAAQGDEFTADNVLVLRVQVGDAGYTDAANNPVPETIFKGKGEALLFHGGRVVRGTWSKPGLDGALTLSTKAGPLTVPAGRTWIELVPATGGDVTFP
ncbi:DUF3048 domain-containing protein [Nocardioides pacificus]